MTEKNKVNAKAFYDLMFNQCKPREAIDLYSGADYIQHNPEVADGKAAFIDYFERMVAATYRSELSSFKAASSNSFTLLAYAPVMQKSIWF